MVADILNFGEQFIAVATAPTKGLHNNKKKMELGDILDELLVRPEAVASLLQKKQPQSATVTAPTEGLQQQHRDRLAALAAGGQAKAYLGKTLTSDQIDSLDDDVVEKPYAR